MSDLTALYGIVFGAVVILLAAWLLEQKDKWQAKRKTHNITKQ